MAKWKKIKAILLVVACALLVIDGIYLWITNSSHEDHVKVSEVITQQQAEKTKFVPYDAFYKKYPSNTVDSVDEAIEKGFESVVLHARLTKDEQWVCSVDENLRETTGHDGNVADYTYFELLKFTLINKKEEMANPVINLLDEVLKKCSENAVEPIVYVHSGRNADELIKIFEKNSLIDKVTLMSENFDYLLDVQKTYPNIKTLYRVSAVDDIIIDSLKMLENGRVCFDGSLENNDAEILLKIRGEKQEFSCYNVNETEQLKLYSSIGAVEIITDKFIP